MTTDLARLRVDVAGFLGRFFYDAERGDLAYIANDCDDRTCECERRTNSDGDQDCSVPIGGCGGVDETVGDPIARMLNAAPALLDEVARLDRAMRDAWAAQHDALTKLSDAKLRLEHVTAARDEACELAMNPHIGRARNERERRIAELRKVGQP